MRNSPVEEVQFVRAVFRAFSELATEQKLTQMPNFIITARNVQKKGSKNVFGDEPGPISFLIVPDNATDFHPSDRAESDKKWIAKLVAGRNLQDVLIYVHGYNMDRDVTIERHKVLKKGLAAKGWKGELITFAWPSKQHTAMYWEDRFDALDVANSLVTRCIRLLNDQTNEGCAIRCHVIAHSTGALIVRESFCQGQKATIGDGAWSVGQMILIGGDIASDSMTGSSADGLYRHCGRITNFFSNYDSALMVSNIKRVGTANRVGRVGLPLGTPEMAIDVNCSAYYKANEKKLKRKVVNAELSHSWHFWSDEFLTDLVYTLDGTLDRHVIPTRTVDANGEFWLK